MLSLSHPKLIAPSSQISDVQVPFTGVLIRYRTTELNQDAFTTLAPGASYETVINIAALHAVQGGDYRVVSSGAIPFAAPNSNELAGAISFQSNSLTISLDDEAVAQTASVIPALDRRTILTSCSGSEDAAQRAALEDAAKLATAAAEATDASNNASLSKFSEYFKTTSSSVRSSVAARLRAVASEASSTTSGSTRYYCSDEYGYCQPNVLAYAIPSLDVIANVGAFHSNHHLPMKAYFVPISQRQCDNATVTTPQMLTFPPKPSIFRPLPFLFFPKSGTMSDPRSPTLT